MMVTIGQVFIHIESNKRWRVNGKVKTWKRRPENFQIPVKHGLYRYGYITQENIHEFKLESD